MVEGVEVEVWVVAASRKMAGIYGDAEVELSGSSMAGPSPVVSEQNEAGEGLDLD